MDTYPFDCARCGHDRRRLRDLHTYWRGRMWPMEWLRMALDVYDADDNDLGGEFRFDGSYGSTLDLTSWRAQLCEACCVELRAWIDAGAGPGVEESQLG